jgi:hypothetical protein
MSHIFISYKHTIDGDFAEVLIRKIIDAGFRTWAFSNELQAGEDWRIEIDEAIKDSLALIVIMSPEAKTSEYVTYEWSFALGAGVKVIPVMYSQTALHPRLESLQYLDFTSRTLRPWDTLINSVKRAISHVGTYIVPIPRDTPNYIKEAIAALDSPNSSDRAGAFDTLLQARDSSPVAKDALLSALKHPNREVRILTSLSLAKYKNMQIQVIPGLLEGLHTNEHNRSASETLGRIGALAVTGLLEALSDKSRHVRSGAIKALGIIKDASAVPILIEIINNNYEEQEIKKIAIDALGMIGDASAVPLLLNFFNTDSKDIMLQDNAINALIKIKDSSATQGLMKASEHLNEVGQKNLQSIQQLQDDGINDQDDLDELSYLNHIGDEIQERLHTISMHLDDE